MICYWANTFLPPFMRCVIFKVCYSSMLQEHFFVCMVCYATFHLRQCVSLVRYQYQYYWSNYTNTSESAVMLNAREGKPSPGKPITQLFQAPTNRLLQQTIFENVLARLDIVPFKQLPLLSQCLELLSIIIRSFTGKEIFIFLL